MRIDEKSYHKYSLSTFASAKFDATKSKFLFHDSNDESNSAIFENLKMKKCDKKRKHNQIQSCIKNQSTETSLHESLENLCMQIEIDKNAKKISSNFVYFSNNAKIIDHDISFLPTLNQNASTRNTCMKNTTNVMSKIDKNTANNLNYT